MDRRKTDFKKINQFELDIDSLALAARTQIISSEGYFIDCGKDIFTSSDGTLINCTPIPENSTFIDMKNIVSADAPEEIYISPVGCYGIVRRKQERNLKINERLEEVLLSISSQMSAEEIEKGHECRKEEGLVYNFIIESFICINIAMSHKL